MLLRVRKILVPVDYSPGAACAVRAAAQIADDNEAKLRLLHVRPILDAVLRGAAGRDAPRRPTLDSANYETRLRDWAEELIDAEFEAVVVTGDVTREIIAASARQDLLVVPSHAHGALRDFLLGSTTERVLRAAKCNTLLVRAPVQTADGG